MFHVFSIAEIASASPDISKEGLVGGLPDAAVPSESRTGAKFGANMNCECITNEDKRWCIVAVVTS